MFTVSFTPDAVLKALSHIIDPDLGVDIVSAGFIKELKVTQSTLLATFSFTS